MNKCKFCQAELAENGTFCPSCGKDNAEAVAEEAAAEAVATEETVCAESVTEEAQTAEPVAEEAPKAVAKKATPGKIALAVVAIVVLAAILIALLLAGSNDKAEGGEIASEPAQETTEAVATVPADGNPDDATCKGTYTVSDEEAVAAKDTVVATIGDAQMTSSELQVYYWSIVNSYLSSEYGYYIMMYGGLDYTQPLDTQLSFEDQSRTWQQYFLQEALNYWQLSLALSQEAQKAGMELSAEDQEMLANIETNMMATAESYGMSLEELLKHNVGAGADIEDLVSFQELSARGNTYYLQEIEKFVPTEEDLEAFFAEHEAQYETSGITKDGKYVDVRHILIGLEGGTVGEDGVTTFSEEDWANAEAEAKAVLDEWLAGDKTEDSFAELANAKSEDAGSNTKGGLYEQVYEGQMVQAFNDWCFDETRQYGDYDIVKTEYGFHIMFYVDSEPMWKYYAESDWKTEQTNQFTSALVEQYPMEVSYEDIVLGYVNMAA